MTPTPPVPTPTELRAALASVTDAQHAWAARRGLRVDAHGYVPRVEANLFGPLSDAARAAYEGAAGGETRDEGDRPAKMRSLVSSSALALNAFDYWAGRDKTVLAAGLGRPVHSDPAFEVRFPTVMRGTPPHLDVVLQTSGPILAIESKFAEWLRPHRPHAASLAPYLAGGRTVWAEAGLLRCQRLAEELGTEGREFELLDVPQLLKHTLGLAGIAAGFELMVLYFDVAGAPGARFRWELERFRERCGPELGFGFHVVTYQEMIARMKAAAGGEHEHYLAYLAGRYGSSGLLASAAAAAQPA